MRLSSQFFLNGLQFWLLVWQQLVLPWFFSPKCISLEFVSNIFVLVLAMVGLAFLSATLNGSLPDIVLSTSPIIDS
jgi:hypothetical protein